MKKTPQQLELILAEAERVNAVLVNDYTSLKEKVKNLTFETEALKTRNSYLEGLSKSQKDDLDRMNLIVEYEREQRFDLEQNHTSVVVAMNKLRIELMSLEDKQTTQQATIKQHEKALRSEEKLCKEYRIKISELEESLKGLKTNFDGTYHNLHEAKTRLEQAENERDQHLQKLTTTSEQLAKTRDLLSEIENRESDHNKLMELEQTHRVNLEIEIDEVQKRNRRLVQQVAELNGKEKAGEKSLEEHKLQIAQLERVREHLTLLLDKEKQTKGGTEQEEMEGNMKQLNELKEQELLKLQEANREYQQRLESALHQQKAQAEKRKANERESSRKIKTLDEALQKEREEVELLRKAILQIREKHKEDLKSLQTELSSSNDAVEQSTMSNEMELKISQYLQEEETELEKLSEEEKEEGKEGEEEKQNLKTEGKEYEEHSNGKFDEEQARSFDIDRGQMENEKIMLEEDKTSTDNELMRSVAIEREQMESEKIMLAEEKASIDNELLRLVEQRLELQQMKMIFEDKEQHYRLTIKEKDAKIAELEKGKAEGRNVAAEPKSPVSDDAFGFLNFMKKKEPEAGTGVEMTDEERKAKIENEYQLLLTDINTALFQKKEQIRDIEKNTGTGNYFKKMGLGGLKSGVTRLEELQMRVKKSFHNIEDGKKEYSSSEEISENQIIKAFRNELT